MCTPCAFPDAGLGEVQSLACKWMPCLYSPDQAAAPLSFLAVVICPHYRMPSIDHHYLSCALAHSAWSRGWHFPSCVVSPCRRWHWDIRRPHASVQCADMMRTSTFSCGHPACGIHLCHGPSWQGSYWALKRNATRAFSANQIAWVKLRRFMVKSKNMQCSTSCQTVHRLVVHSFYIVSMVLKRLPVPWTSQSNPEKLIKYHKTNQKLNFLQRLWAPRPSAIAQRRQIDSGTTFLVALLCLLHKSKTTSTKPICQKKHPNKTRAWWL